MNLTVHTPDTAAQQGRDPQAPRGPLSCNIDMSALHRMGMKELCDFRSVMNTMGNILSGFCCQPRFDADDDERAYNEAGRLIETLTEFINGYEQAAYNVALAASPKRPHDIEYRAWTVLGFRADMTDELGESAVFATQAIHDVATAKGERWTA